jgi:integrase
VTQTAFAFSFPDQPPPAIAPPRQAPAQTARSPAPPRARNSKLSGKTTRPALEVKTFADAVAYVQRRSDWSKPVRDVLASNVRRMGWVLAIVRARVDPGYILPERRKLDLTTIPFDIASINQRLRGVSYGAAGFERERSFRTAKSGFRRLGRELGKVLPHQAAEPPPGDPFAAFIDATTVYGRASARRFVAWCHDNGLTPKAVTGETMTRYAEFLEQNHFAMRIDRIVPHLVKVWTATAAANPDWPQAKLVLPGHRPPPNPPLSSYPASFQEEVAALVRRMGGTDTQTRFRRIGKKKPLRPATIKTRLACIRGAAAALIATGTDPQSITGLKDLVTEKAAERIVTFYWNKTERHRASLPESERQDFEGGYSTNLDGICSTLLIIAQHYCKIPIPPEDLRELKELAADVRSPKQGRPTRKNRDRLRLLFDDRRNLTELMLLPRKLMREALEMLDWLEQNKKHLTAKQVQARLYQAARKARTAILIGILCRIPLRIKNLASIRIGINLKFSGATSDVVTLAFEAFETKNWFALEFSVGARLVEMLRVYIDKFLPILEGGRTDIGPHRWLFPAGEEGRSGPLSIETTRTSIETAIYERVGVRINPHLFRAIAVRLCLEHSPGALEFCRQLLGDKTLQIVLAHYAALEAKEAARHQDLLVDREEDRLSQLATSRAKSARHTGGVR